MKKFLRASIIVILAAVCSSVFAKTQALPSGFEPCAVSNMTGKWLQEDGKNYAQLSFVTPTQATKYNSKTQQYDFQDLADGITKIEVKRSTYDQYNYQTIYTFEAPEKGATLEYTDKGTDEAGLAYGRWDYRVVVWVDNTKNNEWNWDAMKTVVVGQVPEEVEKMQAEGNQDGTVIISFTAPALSTEGEPIVMPMTAVVQEMTGSEPPTFITLQTLENVEPSKDYSVTLEGVKKGSHSYVVKVSTESGSTREAIRNTFVGADLPGYVDNAAAKQTASGITVSWTAPTTGQHNGNFGNPADLTYRVMRKHSVYETGVKIADGIKETTIEDNFSADTEQIVMYDIYAINSEGEGLASTTNQVLTGPSQPLPFAENFDTKDEYGNLSFDHTWLKSYTGYYCTWYTTSDEFILGSSSVSAHNGGGMAYAMYSDWGTTDKWDAITTCHIDFSSAEEPTISFWLYDLAKGGSDIVLKIQYTTDDGATFADALVEPMGNAEAEGWRQLTADLTGLKGAAQGQVRFCTVAKGSNCHAIIIDEVLIRDEKNPNGIERLSISQPSASRIYNLQGQPVSAGHNGIVITNGKAIIKK